MKFEKPALSIQDQIALLTRRGMVISNTAEAEYFLSKVSYYRLRGYWIPFEAPAEEGDHAFKQGTTFDQVVDAYNFDREFRLLVLDAIERVEVAVRTQWAHHFAVSYGAHSHLYKNLFKEAGHFERSLESLEDEIRRSSDLFIAKYKSKYTVPEIPPIWISVELMSLGQLSRWISNIRFDRDKKAISSAFDIPGRETLLSFVHHLAYVRNVCAHHGRLWNRKLAITFQPPRNLPRGSEAMLAADETKIHNTLVVLDHLMGNIAPSSSWKQRLDSLLAGCPDPTREAMGFPSNWHSLAPW